MMKKYMFLLLSITLMGCTNYLDVKSSNRLAVPVKLEDLQGLLDDQVTMNNRRTPSMAQAAADDSFMPHAILRGMTPEAQLQYRWQPFDYIFPNDWSAGYQPVYNSNYCLEMLERIDPAENPDRWNNVHGSALYFKAYYYLGLLWAFAPAFDPQGNNDRRGIVLRNSSDFNVASQFATVAESYAAVIDMASRALPYLPDRPQVKARPSRWAAHALLARAYLSMARYAEAERHADKCLLLGAELIDFNNPRDGITIDANTPFAKFTKETIFYSEMTPRSILHLPPSGALADTTLYALFGQHDLRRRAYYRASGAYHAFKGTHANSVNWLFSGLTTAEVLLIRGECRARRADVAGSMDDLNTLLRSRWDAAVPFVPTQAATAEQATGLLLNERRKELAMRGIRWSDIKRLNIEGRNIILRRRIGDDVVTLAPNADAYVLPMPADLRSFLPY